MEKLNGLLRVRVIRGVDLAVRDMISSDPYVIVRMGKQDHGRESNALCLRTIVGNPMPSGPSPGIRCPQDHHRESDAPFFRAMRLKTRVIKRNLNPEWNENLTLSVSDNILPIRIEVFDRDTFTPDDPMGYAELDIHPFMEAVQMKANGVPCSQIHKTLVPNRQNCFAEESCIKCVEGKIIQDMWLRLRNVERGEIELQLEWINIKVRSS